MRYDWSFIGRVVGTSLKARLAVFDRAPDVRAFRDVYDVQVDSRPNVRMRANSTTKMAPANLFLARTQDSQLM